MTAQRPVILASSSPYRAELLSRLGLSFEQRSPEVDETPGDAEAPEAYVERLALEKARAVGAHDALVVGSDQAAVLDGMILGKPGTPERAAHQLLQASGKRVTFLTGVCLLDAASGSARTSVVPFHVTFRRLSEASIQRYIQRDAPVDCAGSFRAEGLGITLFQRMEGEDPTALVGLPLIRLVDFLLEAGLELP